jgi:uncharacterized protein YyaL (SSP411 family)
LSIAVLVLPMAAAALTMEAGSSDPALTQAPAAPTASVQLEAARAAAAAGARNILVKFGASWCSWCRRFDAFVDSDEVGSIMSQHFVVVRFTVQERPEKRALNTLGAQALMDEWGGRESALPFYVFLDAAGRKIADSNAMPTGANVGYPTTAVEIQSFTRLLERAAPRMTAQDRAHIAQFLTLR